MMGIDQDKQNQLIFINLDDFVPQDHLLRQILHVVDFSFIYDKVRHLYSPFGRRSIDPVLLMKMLFIGYLYGIPSERKLEQEVKLNLAYRWFLGLDLVEPVPDHSTLSQNRRRRFKNSNVFQEIFDHIVTLCVNAGLVTGEVIVTDSTHIKASASKSKVEKVYVAKPASEYLKDLEEEAKKLEKQLKQKNDRQDPPPKRGRPRKEDGEQQEIVKSTTDPDAGYMNRRNKPTDFHYLSHTSIDTQHGIITDVHVTPGNVNDHEPVIARLREQQTKFGIRIDTFGADKGYDFAVVHHGLEKMGITGYVAPVTSSHNRAGSKDKKEFVYDNASDTYTCPQGKTLTFTHLQWKREMQGHHKVYAAKAKDCRACPLRTECFGKTATRRTITRPMFHEAFERNRERSSTKEYRFVQRMRRIWCEGTFGTLKLQHNLIRTLKRGIRNVAEQCLLSALALNLKRMVKAMA